MPIPRTNAYEGSGRLLAPHTPEQPRRLRNGNRTAVTHPDGHFFTYGRDGLNRPTQLAANGGPGLVGTGYFDHGAAATVNRANGTLTGLGYDDILRPDGVIHFFAGGGHAYWGWGSNSAGKRRARRRARPAPSARP